MVYSNFILFVHIYITDSVSDFREIFETGRESLSKQSCVVIRAYLIFDKLYRVRVNGKFDSLLTINPTFLL